MQINTHIRNYMHIFSCLFFIKTLIFTTFYTFLLDITQKCNYTKNKSNPFLNKQYFMR